MPKDKVARKSVAIVFKAKGLTTYVASAPICDRRAQVRRTSSGFLISCPTGDKQPIKVDWQVTVDNSKPN